MRTKLRSLPLTPEQEQAVHQWVTQYLLNNVAEVTRDRERYEERRGRRLGGEQARIWLANKTHQLRIKAIDALYKEQ